MEIKYLQTLKAILETGSFQGAAQALNYTQSTITFQVQQLEQELGSKLFEKIGRRMQLTEAGRGLLPYVDAVLQAVTELQAVSQISGELTGTLKVGMPESLLTYCLQPLLKQFREQAPQVKLSLQALNCYQIRDRIMSGEADIGVHYEVEGYGPNIVKAGLAAFPLVLVASPLLAAEQRDFMTPGQRKPVCLIAGERKSVTQRTIDQYLKERRIVMEQEFELDSIEAIKRSVASNLGVAFLPRFTVEAELANGTLQAVPTALHDCSIKAVCAYHKNKWLSPAMQLFMALLQNCLQVR